MGEFGRRPNTPYSRLMMMFAMAPANYDAPLAAELKLIAGLTVKIAEPLARYTSMKIGGPADYFIEVENEAALANLLERAIAAPVKISVCSATAAMS